MTIATTPFSLTLTPPLHPSERRAPTQPDRGASALSPSLQSTEADFNEHPTLCAIRKAVETALANGEPQATLIALQCDIRVVVQSTANHARALYGFDPTTGKLRYFHSLDS